MAGTGNAEAMANAAAEGIKNARSDVTAFAATNFSASLISDYDSFAFRCPSTGGEQLEVWNLSRCSPLWRSSWEEKSALLGSYG